MRKGPWIPLLLLSACLFAFGARAETGVVTASALVVREGPDVTRAAIGEVPNGTRLELLAFEDGWYRVMYGTSTGYVNARYVRVDLPETAAVTPAPIAPIPPTAQPDFSLPALQFTGENNPGFPLVLKPGDVGNSVLDLQVTLQAMGYAVTTDGQYGYDTQAAVMKLQAALGIEADGIVGAQTRRLIGNQNPGGVELLDWWLGGNVAYARLTEASIVDVRTGKRLRISRYGGDNHLDAEPLTAEDTKILKSISGGEWTWARRPIWLEAGGRTIAASMHCMPHEGQHIWDNNFDGHICIHFLNSRTHDTDRIDEEHAACVTEAWNKRTSYVPK